MFILFVKILQPHDTKAQDRSGIQTAVYNALKQ